MVVVKEGHCRVSQKNIVVEEEEGGHLFGMRLTTA
jgi:hypothetical protein